MSLTGYVYSPALFIMSKSSYNKRSKEDQTAVTEAAKLSAAANRQKVSADEAVGVDVLRKAGVNVNEKPDKAAFQAAHAPAYAEYAKKFGQANIDEIKNF